MRPESIAKLDRFAGKPLCALLSLVEGVRRTLFRRPHEPPRKILFIKLIEMGSTVLACPAFNEAQRQVGRDNIYILVFAPNRAIVDLLPYFPEQNVLTIDDRNLARFVLDLLRVMLQIRREGIDTAIDMEGLTPSSAIITWLTGARQRIGFHNYTSQGPYRGRLFTRELNYTFQHHVSKMFLSLVRAAAAPDGQVPALKEAIPDSALELPPFEPEDAEREQVRAILRQRLGADPGRRVVVLNPNCSDLLPLRRWPTERFVELGRRLLDEFPDVTIAITGAPDEQEQAEQAAAAIGKPERVACLAGHTTLREVLTLYCMSELMISNDSGPVHFASLTPVKIIALFGPETPLLYGPLGNALSISAELSCSPCVNILNHRFSPCTDNQCMQQIAVERVLIAARERLAG